MKTSAARSTHCHARRKTVRLVLTLSAFLTAVATASSAQAISTIDPSELPPAHFYAITPPSESFFDWGTRYSSEYTWYGRLGPFIPVPHPIVEITHNEDRSQFYGIGNHEFYTLDITLQNPTLVTPAGADDEVDGFGWAMSVSYDTLRDRALVATLVGKGFLYWFNEAANQLEVISDFDNIDVTAIAYSSNDDLIYGIQQKHGEPDTYALHTFSSDGQLLETRPLDIPTIGYGHLRTRQLFSVGDYLAFLDYPSESDQSAPLYAIDPRTAQAWLVAPQPFVANPEPSSLLMLIIGVLTLCLARTLRRRS